MAHPRKLIREAVAKILKNAAIPTVVDNVFSNRPTPLWTPDETPCICVYLTDEEASTRGNDKNQISFYDRVGKLYVEILVASEEGFDDELDAIAEKVEELLLPKRFLVDPDTLAEVTDHVVFRSVRQIFIGEKVEETLASMRYEIDVQFTTDVKYDEPDDDFDKAGVKWKIPPLDVEHKDGLGVPIPVAEDLIPDIHEDP